MRNLIVRESFLRQIYLSLLNRQVPVSGDMQGKVPYSKVDKVESLFVGSLGFSCIINDELISELYMRIINIEFLMHFTSFKSIRMILFSFSVDGVLNLL